MKVRYSPKFYRQYKKADVRIRNRLDERIAVFLKNTNDPQLHNHVLKREWKGCRSIDITADWRAIYKEIQYEEELVAYFVAIGTHDQLFKQKSS